MDRALRELISYDVATTELGEQLHDQRVARHAAVDSQCAQLVGRLPKLVVILVILVVVVAMVVVAPVMSLTASAER